MLLHVSSALSRFIIIVSMTAVTQADIDGVREWP
jgi:hypothetical protein